MIPVRLDTIRHHLGSLDRLRRMVRLGVMIASSSDLREHPKVADGASTARVRIPSGSVARRFLHGLTERWGSAMTQGTPKPWARDR